MKLYSLLFSIFGMIRFLFIEFNLIERYGLVSNLLMLIYMVMLILWVLEIKKIQVVALINRSHAFVMMLVIYFVAVQITSLLSYNALNSTLSATQMILPFFMIVYYAGFWIFFSEWYREAFIYKNPTLLDI